MTNLEDMMYEALLHVVNATSDKISRIHVLRCLNAVRAYDRALLLEANALKSSVIFNDLLYKEMVLRGWSLDDLIAAVDKVKDAAAK
jgi:hypothetical protein